MYSMKDVIEISDSLMVGNDEAFSFLLDSVKAKKCFSMIRLGDGEGKLLSGVASEKSDKVDDQLRIWFGNVKFSKEDVENIRSELLGSLLNSDIIGLPTSERLSQRAQGEPTNDAVNCYKLWLEVIEFLGLSALRKKLLVPASINHWLQKKKGVKRLILNSENISIISHSRNIAANIDNFFSPIKLSSYMIPAETWSREEPSSVHYPDVYRKMVSLIEREGGQSLFFVGGGVLGKIYCSKIKEAGGVAVDMGGVMDGWANKVPPQRAGMSKNTSVMSLEYLFR